MRLRPPMQCAPSSFVQFEGDPADAMYIIAEGHIKIARISNNRTYAVA
jgi:CRP-like cAMP-binding protein